jgi:ubiquinone biosynthesis protein UbiJ
MGVIETIRQKRQSGDAKAEDLPLVFQAGAELASDPEFQAELKNADDFTLQLDVEDTPVKAWVKIAGHQFSTGAGPLEGAECTLIMKPEVAKQLVLGNTDEVRNAYMSGDLRVEGDLSKLMALRPILESLRPKLGGA